MVTKKDSWDNEGNEIASSWMCWYVPMEDKFFGTLLAKRQVKMKNQEGIEKLQWVYEFNVDEGRYHVVDSMKKVLPDPVILNKGDFLSVGGKVGIDAQMKNVKIGQKIGMKFIDEQPSKTKGWAPAKNIKVYAPKNDDGTPMVDEDVVNAHDNAGGGIPF